MTLTRPTIPGAFCLVLHSHLPWLPGHGVWPLGEEWLHQALVESYVPVVAALDSLASQGHRDILTLGVTPILAAQLDSPAMVRDAATWAGMWEQRALELEQLGSAHEKRIACYEAQLARRSQALLGQRWSAGGSPVWRSLRDAGVVELLGGPLTHPLLPLAQPEVARFSLAAGRRDALWRWGTASRGVWSPECAWSPPMRDMFAEAGIGHFLVDEQTVVDAGGHAHAAWRVLGESAGVGEGAQVDEGARVGGGAGVEHAGRGDGEVIAVPRDLAVTNLVWSSREGYPTGGAYRDFHARERRIMSGLRLWAITSPGVPEEAKRGYEPEAAVRQTRCDATHFADQVAARLSALAVQRGRPGLVVAAYDTELFGHWWHEGPLFLEAVIPALREAGVWVTTVEKALASGDFVEGDLALGEGSWGAGKDFSVWNGPAVESLAAEAFWMQRRWLDLIRRERDAGRMTTRRADLDQLTQTLLLALSSDWAFLITRGQSVDYAQRREREHREEFHRLAEAIEGLHVSGSGSGSRDTQATNVMNEVFRVGEVMSDAVMAEVARLGERDRPFPALDARQALRFI